jgi:hypothetical protein
MVRYARAMPAPVVATGRRRPAPPAAHPPRTIAATIAHLQRTAGNRAVATLVDRPAMASGATALAWSALRPLAGPAPAAAVQRDPDPPIATPASYDAVYHKYWTLISAMTKLNGKVVSGIRSDWINDLSAGLTKLGGPGEADAPTLAALDQRFTVTKANIEANVEAAHQEWKAVWAEYKTEREKYVDGVGWSARVLKFLDDRAHEDQSRVFDAWPYLTFDDIAGLQSMLAHKTHERLANEQDERENQQRKKDEAAKLPHFRDFRMRAFAGGQLSVGPVGAEVTSFEIEEVGPKGRSGVLSFAAEGLALGFEASAVGPQSWTDFRTPQPMRIEEFAVPGRLTSAAIYVIYGGGYSYVTFYVPGKEDVVIKSPGHGWGFGGGLSTVAGMWYVRST